MQFFQAADGLGIRQATDQFLTLPNSPSPETDILVIRVDNDGNVAPLGLFVVKTQVVTNPKILQPKTP